MDDAAFNPFPESAVRRVDDEELVGPPSDTVPVQTQLCLTGRGLCSAWDQSD